MIKFASQESRWDSYRELLNALLQTLAVDRTTGG
jgi:hypothetical protein